MISVANQIKIFPQKRAETPTSASPGCQPHLMGSLRIQGSQVLFKQILNRPHPAFLVSIQFLSHPAGQDRDIQYE